MRPHSLKLRPPRGLFEWDRYHDIRKRCIFEAYHGEGAQYHFEYDPDHPDERDPANHPLVFLADGMVIGTIRIDIKLSRCAVFRLVAIDTPWRGMGFGTIMLEMAEAYARARGAEKICLNSVPRAYTLYARNGFNPARWDGCTQNPNEIPVVKEFSRPMQRAVSAASTL